MKTLLLAFLAASLCGCETIKKLTAAEYTHPIVPVISTAETIYTVTNVVTTTNLVAGQPTITTAYNIVPYTNYVTVTNGFATNPNFTTAVEVARRANSAFNPTPSAPIVDWGLTLISLVTAAVAAWKTRKHNQALVELNTHKAALDTAVDVRDTLIKAIETAPKAVSDAIKLHVESVADIKNISAEVSAAVRRVTEPASGN